MGKTLLGLALGIEADQVKGNLLHPALGLSFRRFQTSLPVCLPWVHPLLPGVLGDLVQGVDIDIKNIAVLVNDADGFLHLSVYINFLQAAVDAHTMINMGNKIARLQFPEGPAASGLVFVIGLRLTRYLWYR